MRSVVLRAVVFSLLINLASVVALVWGTNFNPGVFSDIDEPYYFPQPYQSADIPLTEFAQIKDGNLAIFSNPKIKLPHYVLDVFLGKIATAFGIIPIYLGIILDLICCFLGFIIFLKILDTIWGRNPFNQLGAIVGVAIPWLLSLEELLPYSFSIGPHRFFTYAHFGFPSNPLQRGLFTQVSVVGFLLAIYSALSLATQDRAMKFYYRLIGTGLLTGSLLYLYFFAWLSAACLLSLFGALMWVERLYCKSNSSPGISVCKAFLSAFVPFLLISAPGILQLVKGGSLYTPGPASHLPSLSQFLDFSKFWYLPPLSLLGVVWCLWKRLCKKGGLSYGIVGVTLLSTVILTNLQPVLGRWLPPYHFSLFFLHPVISAVLVVPVLCYLSRFRIAPLLSLAPSLLVLLPSVKSFLNQYELREESALVERLYRFTPQSATIATPPYLNDGRTEELKLYFSLLPYTVQSLAIRQSFTNFLNFDSNREMHIRKELTLGYLYFGTPRLLVTCPKRSKIDIPYDDVISGATAFIQAQRAIDCEILNSMPSVPSPCDLISEGRIDFLVMQSGQQNTPPLSVQRSISNSWNTPQGRYTVHQIDYERLKEEVCGNS